MASPGMSVSHFPLSVSNLQGPSRNRIVGELARLMDEEDARREAKNADLERRLKELKAENGRILALRSKDQLDLAHARQELLVAKRTLDLDPADHNPYILVLVDGDGTIFDESYIRGGDSGGKNAAYHLRSMVLEQYGGMAASNVEVIAKVVVNVSGLAWAMKRDGCIDSDGTFREFCIGFTHAMASFDVVDVGQGKERADSKIKELARWHMRNGNCKKILLGVSHDNGYGAFLDEILRDDSSRKLVSVIEAVPTVRDIVSTGVDINKAFGSLFRNECTFAERLTRVGGSGAATTGSTMPTTIKNKSRSDSENSSRSSVGSAQMLTFSQTFLTRTPPSTKPTLGSSTPANRTPSTSYASVCTPAMSYADVSAFPPLPPPTTTAITSPTSNTVILPKANPPSVTRLAFPGNKSPSTTATLTWPPGPRGLDAPIAFNKQSFDALRFHSGKLCNYFYLRKVCPVARCQWRHDASLTQNEILALAHLCRQKRCIRMQSCGDQDCFYGHNCPRVSNGLCDNPMCKFAVDEHPPGTAFTNRSIRLNRYD